VLRVLLPNGSPIGLETDARLDRTDRYGRVLRFVWARGVNVDLELVRRGAAGVWLYDGDTVATRGNSSPPAARPARPGAASGAPARARRGTRTPRSRPV